MDLPAGKMICLETGDRSLEDHTRDFLDLLCRHYPDCAVEGTPNGPRELRAKKGGVFGWISNINIASQKLSLSE